jgi:hypothetical protein
MGHGHDYGWCLHASPVPPYFSEVNFESFLRRQILDPLFFSPSNLVVTKTRTLSGERSILLARITIFESCVTGFGQNVTGLLDRAIIVVFGHKSVASSDMQLWIGSFAGDVKSE